MSDVTPVLASSLPAPADSFDRRRPTSTVGALARRVPLVHAETTGTEVRGLFNEADCNTVVVVDVDGRPLGTLSRQSFLAALAGPNAYALWARRPAVRLAVKPRTVSMDDSLLTATALVSERERDRLSDDIIVVDPTGCVVGGVAVHEVLRALVEDQLVLARQANPLTGLPGNAAIEDELTARIAVGIVFAVTYLDLDRFKLVNDQVGFAVGDQLIVALANAISAAAQRVESFVGHIGGDDFLVVTGDDAVEPLVAETFSRYQQLCSEIAAGHSTARPIVEAVTVSAASVLVDPEATPTPGAIATRLAPVKHEAKQIRGSSHVVVRAC